MGEEQNDRDVLFTMNQKCKKCDTGYMKFNGVAKTSSPPLYSHTCDTCGNKEDYKRAYPDTKLEMNALKETDLESIDLDKLHRRVLEQGFKVEHTLDGTVLYDEEGNKLYSIDEIIQKIQEGDRK